MSINLQKRKISSAVALGKKSLIEGLALTHVWNVIEHNLKLNSNSVPNDYNVTKYGETTDAYEEAIIDQYASLPDGAREDIIKAGPKIEVCGIRTDIHPEWKDYYFDRGLSQFCVHYNQIPATQFSDRIEIAQHLFTFPGPPWLVKLLGVEGEPSLLGELFLKWWPLSPEHGAAAFRHEAAGHAIYDIQSIGEDKSYEAAYALDLNVLGGIEGARAKGLTYWIYNNNASANSMDKARNEVFASIVEGDGNIIDKFPHCATWVKQFYDDYDKYRITPGSAPIDRGIDTTHLIDTGHYYGLGHSSGILDALGVQLNILNYHVDFAPSLTWVKLGFMTASMVLLNASMKDNGFLASKYRLGSKWQYLKFKTPKTVRDFGPAAKKLTKRAATFLAWSAMAAFQLGVLIKSDSVYGSNPLPKAIVAVSLLLGTKSALTTLLPDAEERAKKAIKVLRPGSRKKQSPDPVPDRP
jgi:hypothetical protein